MKIEILNKSHKNQLTDFFLKLKNKTYYNWNRFGELYSREDAEKISDIQVNLSEKDEIGFIAIENNIIKGYAYLRFFPEKKIKRFTTSLGIAIADEYQGQGVGKLLMKFLIEFSKNNGYKKVWLATYTDNIRALNMYIKLGFEIEGIFMYDEYVDNIPRHVVSMALFLGSEFKTSKKERLKLIEKIEKYSL